MPANGSKGLPVISVTEMIERYQRGEALIDISLRAKLNARAVKILLEAHGCKMRSRKEVLQLNGRNRAAWRKLMPQ
jgi:hypothetical protein